MAARCCRECKINFPPEIFGMNSSCRVCDRGLFWDVDAAVDEDWRELVGMAVWRLVDADSPMHGGLTMMTRFDRKLENLIDGVDDFLFECGDRAPRGNE